MLDRTAKAGRGEGAVDHQGHARLVGDGGYRRHVHDLQAWVAQGLAEEEAGLRPDRLAEPVGVAGMDEARLDAEARQGMREEVVATAVDRGGGDDVPAGVHQGRHGEVKRRLPARRADRADTPFQRRDSLLQHRHRRVGDAGVDMACALQVEERGRLLGVVEDVGGGLVDRHGARASRGVRLLARVQAQRVALEGQWVSHRLSPRRTDSAQAAVRREALPSVLRWQATCHPTDANRSRPHRAPASGPSARRGSPQLCERTCAGENSRRTSARPPRRGRIGPATARKAGARPRHHAAHSITSPELGPRVWPT